MIGNCATRKNAISDEELSNTYSGTWINPEVPAEPKMVYFPDGTWKHYPYIDRDIVCCEGKDILIDKWKDSKGIIWFESSWECLSHGDGGYLLAKMSDSGNTLELLFTTQEHRIEEWDIDRFEYIYRIYYRQE
jgi:hypothetical protein